MDDTTIYPANDKEDVDTNYKGNIYASDLNNVRYVTQAGAVHKMTIEAKNLVKEFLANPGNLQNLITDNKTPLGALKLATGSGLALGVSIMLN